jgi:hypothetical protein
VLAALRDAGYTVADLPADGDALIARLTAGVTNEPAVHALRPAFQSFALADYRAQFARLPAAVRDALNARWGEPEADPMLRHGRFMIAGCARATCSSASSRRARATTTTMRATTMRSWCRRMRTWRSTSGCAMRSASTRSSISASTATSNGCRARASRCPTHAGPT